MKRDERSSVQGLDASTMLVQAGIVVAYWNPVRLTRCLSRHAQLARLKRHRLTRSRLTWQWFELAT